MSTMSISADGKIESSLVGTHLEPDVLKVTAELTERYAFAINDDNPRYLTRAQSNNIVAPPLFGIVPVMRILRNSMSNGTLPLSMNRTVHGEQEMTFISQIRPGDVLVSSAQVRHVKEHSTGTTVELAISTNTDNGVERLNQTFTAFIRKNDRVRAPKTPDDSNESPLHEVTTEVDSDQSIRYAKASFTEGIKPHEDHDAACALGYKTLFLQGQCTMAFAAKAIVDILAGGDPENLHAIKVRFSQPVYPSEVLTTRIWRGEKPGQYTFTTIKADGSLVLTNGVAQISRI